MKKDKTERCLLVANPNRNPSELFLLIFCLTGEELIEEGQNEKDVNLCMYVPKMQGLVDDIFNGEKGDVLNGPDDIVAEKIVALIRKDVL